MARGHTWDGHDRVDGLWVHLRNAGGEDIAGPRSLTVLRVGDEVTRVILEVLTFGELQRVDEDRDDGAVVRRNRRVDQRDMTFVEIPHGRHEPDRAAGGAVGVEVVPEVGNGRNDFHVSCS